MSESTTQSQPLSASQSGKVEIAIQIDADLLDQIQHLTKDPSKVVEVAVRQWLLGISRRDDDVTRSLPRNPPLPPRGEWND
jgi:hypothetical protein